MNVGLGFGCWVLGLENKVVSPNTHENSIP